MQMSTPSTTLQNSLGVCIIPVWVNGMLQTLWFLAAK